MIIFVGVSGSGKSLQGRMLADDIGYAWISSGEFLRMLLSGQLRKDMLSGKLLPDEKVIELFDKILELTTSEAQCILDGFPRTIKQTDWLIDQAKSGRFKIDMVFHMSLDHAVAKQRLTIRNRLDDNEPAINERLAEY